MTLTRKLAVLTLTLLTISLVGCSIRAMHPGHRLVARKCSACHVQPDRTTLSTLELIELHEIHEGRVVLDEEQMAQVQAYANEGDPQDSPDVLSD